MHRQRRFWHPHFLCCVLDDLSLIPSSLLVIEKNKRTTLVSSLEQRQSRTYCTDVGSPLKDPRRAEVGGYRSCIFSFVNVLTIVCSFLVFLVLYTTVLRCIQPTKRRTYCRLSTKFVTNKHLQHRTMKMVSIALAHHHSIHAQALAHSVPFGSVFTSRIADGSRSSYSSHAPFALQRSLVRTRPYQAA